MDSGAFQTARYQGLEDKECPLGENALTNWAHPVGEYLFQSSSSCAQKLPDTLVVSPRWSRRQFAILNALEIQPADGEEFPSLVQHMISEVLDYSYFIPVVYLVRDMFPILSFEEYYSA